MHELSLAEELLSACRDRAGGRPIRQIRARCPASVDAVELSDCFALAASQLAATLNDRSLAGAELQLEPVPVSLHCRCGYEGRLGGDHLAGHLAICPQCGHVGEVDTRLELVSMMLADEVEPFGPT